MADLQISDNDMKDLRREGEDKAEREMVEMALSLPLGSKVDKAVALLQTYTHYAMRLSPTGYRVGFSGGKDSCVIKHLAQRSGVPFMAVYNLTTVDPPELIYFIRDHHPDIIINKPTMPMWRMAEEKGLPTRWARWCCREYKENSACGVFEVLGVRVMESHGRMQRWKEFVFNRKAWKYMLAPIAYWTDSDVWQYIHDNNIPYCKLYDEGIKRLGCVGCPMSRHNLLDRYPRYKEMWRRAFMRHYERRGGKVLGMQGTDPHAYFEWWASGQRVEGWTDPAQCTFDEMLSNV